MSSMASRVLRVAGIVDDSIVDGPGLRLTVFLQGCTKNCAGCHNPQAMDINGGTEYTAAQIFEKIQKNRLLDGVTFSGGEPFLQACALIPLAQKIKGTGLALAIYTGYTFEELLQNKEEDAQRLLKYADALIDGPFMLEKRSLALPFRGSANQRILDVQKSIAAGRAIEDASWDR